MRVMTTALGVAAALVSASATAHGPHIQITKDNDQITTRQLFPEEPYTALTAPKRVYVIPLLESAGVWYARPNDALNTTTGQARYVSGPGITYGYGAAFSTGNHFNLNLIDRLQTWNGSAFEDPGLEEMEVYRTSGPTVAASAVTSDGLSDASPATMEFAEFSTISPTSHASARYRLLGDGTNPGGGDDGVYLLSMTLSSTESGLAASDSFYFVLHKNALADEVRAAVGSLGFDAHLVQYVPEPGALTLLAIAGMFGAGASGQRRWR